MINYNVWLQLILGAGNNRLLKIIDYFKTAKNVHSAGYEACLQSGLFTNRELSRIKKTHISIAEKIVSDCKKLGIEIIALGDKRYPISLSVIDNPPLVIYVKGKLPDFNGTPSICIVGPREASDFGKRSAYSLSYRLSRAGFIVVSGGAIGIDTYAHAGTLKADGITALVMACGTESKYLPENAAMRKAVTEKGCLISEYPPFADTTKYAFPIRNRIMSALTLGTVVIEAGTKSGALITARNAYEQGRDVFVIPGSPNKKEYLGSNALLRDGAKPLLDASDIFNEYILRFPDKINIERAYQGKIISDTKQCENEKSEKKKENFNETLSKEAKIVYNCLDKQKFLPEEIKNTGLSSQQLLSALTELEMEFLIRALPGGMFEKIS
ncbi:MAG: DNA-processing protein DprA [Clostridia bacterium]|nr:DNA-processing protein DprA [Clostridia bacterium]